MLLRERTKSPKIIRPDPNKVNSLIKSRKISELTFLIHCPLRQVFGDETLSCHFLVILSRNKKSEFTKTKKHKVKSQ